MRDRRSHCTTGSYLVYQGCRSNVSGVNLSTYNFVLTLAKGRGRRPPVMTAREGPARFSLRLGHLGYLAWVRSWGPGESSGPGGTTSTAPVSSTMSQWSPRSFRTRSGTLPIWVMG